MTELTCTQFEADQTFVDPYSGDNEVFDLERFRLLADRIKPLLGPRLENRIHSVLEEFVCNSSSRYSRRFPRVKRCLDAIAAWLNYLDAFRAKDIDKEAIKHAIEYLLKDGRVTHFEDPVALNTGISRVDPDSLTEQNAMKTMNVWSFIKEKDYWLCQDQAKTQNTRNHRCKSPPRPKQQLRKCRKENCNSDLDVEVGSSTKESPNNVLHKRHPSTKLRYNEKIDNTQLSEPKVQHIQETTISDHQNSFHPKEASTFKEVRFSSTRNLPKPGTRVPSNGDQNYDQNLCPKSPKLKLVIYKTTSTNCCTLWNPVVTNLSVPCKSSHLIVRLFEADPSLSDSCLVLIRRKFEHEISNACSCMNDILKKLDNCTIRRLCLNCQIRPGRIDLTLQRDDSSKTRLFLARVPICLNVHKRESSRRNVRTSNRRESRDSNEDPCVSDDCRANKKEFQERQVSFYSQCSNHGLEETQTTHKKDATEFAFSTCFTKSDLEQDISSANENCVECELHDEDSAFINENDDNADENESCVVEDEVVIDKEQYGAVINGDEDETLIKGEIGTEMLKVNKNSTCVNSSVVEDGNQRKLDHIVCSYSLGSFEDEQVERKRSMIGGDHGQCHCEVLYVNNNSEDLDENSRAEEKSYLEQYGLLRNNVIERNHNVEIRIETKESITESEISTPRVQAVSKLQTNIVTIRSTLQVQETLVAGIDRNILETDKNSLVKETYSADSICSSTTKITRESCGSKCSRCGKDLSEEEIKSIAKCVQPDVSDSENHGRLNSMSTKNLSRNNLTKSASPTKCLPSSQSKLKTVQNPTISTFVTNTSRECVRNCNNENIMEESASANEDLDSCKCSNNSNSESSGRSNRKQFSPSNSCMDRESFPGEDSKRRNRMTNVKFGSSCCRKPSCSSSRKTLRKEKDTGSRHLFRGKNSFWRGSIVPGSIRSSFPALDRIKYLIRKKLRRLLLEERDKGTSTSKTYLRNDRYLVSISSGKLNEGRICSSIRCPFTTKNQTEVRGPQKTFTEGSSLGKKEKRDTEEGVGCKCRKMIQDNKVFRKIRLGEISRFLGQKINNHRTIDGDPLRDGKRRERSSMESFASTKVIFFEDDDPFSSDKMKHKRNCGLKAGKLSKRMFKEEIAAPKSVSGKNYHGSLQVSTNKSRRREDEDILRGKRLKSFDNCLFKCCGACDCEEDKEFMKLLNNYERRISDLDADFRLKLLQYVALCRSVKDLLMKRLPQTDDVYEGSSSYM